MIFSTVFSIFLSLIFSFTAASDHEENALEAVANVKFILFNSAEEIDASNPLITDIQGVAHELGNNIVELHDLPTKAYRDVMGRELHPSWYKLQVLREAISSNPESQWICTIDLEATTEVPHIRDLIKENPETLIFLKKSATGIAFGLYRNNQEMRGFSAALMKRATSRAATEEFIKQLAFHPLIISKVKYL